MKNNVDIILLHGWGCDHTIWNSLHRHLEEFLTATDFVAPPAPPLGDATEVSAKPQTSRIFALDFPGFGSEPEPETPWNIEDYTRWLERYTAERGIENPVLVGHSFGGRVAIVYASRNPVSKVVLVDAAGVKPRRSAVLYKGVVVQGAAADRTVVAGPRTCRTADRSSPKSLRISRLCSRFACHEGHFVAGCERRFTSFYAAN